MRIRNLLFGVVAFLAVQLGVPAFSQASPHVDSLSPSSGAVGTQVTLSGSGFGAMQGNSTVTFNNLTATAIRLT